MAGYGDDAGFATWLETNGFTLPAGAPSPAVLRQRGSSYIDATYGTRFSGVPVDGIDQDRAWPRTGANSYGVTLLPSVIPAAVIHASYHAALAEAQRPGSLAVTVTPGKRVKRQKVEGIEREFFDSGADAIAASTPVLTAIEGLLAPVLGSARALPAILVI